MLETRIKILEDRPDRIVVRQSLRPWQWGGPGVLAMLLSPLLISLIWLAIDKKIVCDKFYQSVIVNNRFLVFQRRKEIPFSEIKSIILLPRVVTRVAGGSGRGGEGSWPVTLDLGGLSLMLADNTSVNIVTTYRDSRELATLGDKLGVVMGKPFTMSEEAVSARAR